MSLVVNTNVASINAQTNLARSTMSLGKSMEKLASGFRINRASDDAAGLSLSEILRSQIRGKQQALNNTQDGINVLNIVDASLQTMMDNLQRVRELSVQAANDTLGSAQRSAIDVEVTQLGNEVNRIASSTKFNSNVLLDGSQTSFKIQVGADADDNIDISSAFATANWSSVGLTALSVLTQAGANSAIGMLDLAITSLNTRRAKVGAYTNRLDVAVQNLQTSIENTSASESRIRNVDVAQESARMTRFQILQQASASILGQANQTPQLALQLLKG